MIRINNVNVSLDTKDYRQVISQQLNISKNKIKDVKLVKQAVDARRKNKVHFVCSFEFNIDNEDIIIKKYPKLNLVKVKPYYYPVLKSNDEHIIVVGSGPAGLFCAYNLARANQKVTLVERGSEVDKRKEDIDNFFKTGKLFLNSNVQFGEGGAGTFSDGKLTTGVKDKRKQFILETFVAHGANKDILYLNKPHVGTDYLINVVKNMRQEIIKNGGEVLFDSQLIDIETQNQKLTNIKIKQGDQIITMKPDKLVLAIGHSARDTYEMLYQRGLRIEPKAFAVGLRIEHLQSFINEHQYGRYANHPKLKAADYKLAVKTSSGRGVYTFCMCPGGKVINSSSESGGVVVNGMSNQARDDVNANSAILVTVGPEDFENAHPLSGIKYQQDLEHKAFMLGGGNYHVPVMKIEDYLETEPGNEMVKCSVLPGVKNADLNELFSKEINTALKEGLILMDQKISGFASNAMLSGVESRSSAPVKFYRDESYQSNIKGIYPIGEGAGYAGGIMSSAIDGLKCSEFILEGENKKMSVLEIALIGIGLAMDAFAVSICKGLAMKKMSYQKAVIIALFFGAFQALMPALGYVLGTTFASKIATIDHWIAFILLGLIGINMIKEAMSKDEDGCLDDALHFGNLIMLSVATSVDALAIGITFAFFNVSIVLSTVIIGIITFVICVIGVKVGNVFGEKYKSKAEFAGGVLLIIMGCKILVDHLFF